MAKQKATSDWWDDNLSGDILGQEKGGKKPASEWGDDAKNKTESSFYSKGKQQSEWGDSPEKAKQESVWGDDDSEKKKEGSVWGDDDQFMGAKPRDQSAWTDEAPAKPKAQSEWGEAPASSQTTSQVTNQATNPAATKPETAKPKEKKSSGWGKSFRMSFGKTEETSSTSTAKSKPSKFSKPVKSAPETKTPPPSKGRNEKEAWKKVPPPKSRDNRFSFGLSALDPFSSTTSAPKHQNSKQSATAAKKKDTGTPPQDSFFGLGSLLDPFGFFGSSSDEVEQKPQPRTEKATEAAPDTNANNAGGGGRGEEAKTQHRGAQRPKNPAVEQSTSKKSENPTPEADEGMSFFGVKLW